MDETDNNELHCTAALRVHGYHIPSYTPIEELEAQGWEMMADGVYEMLPVFGPFLPQKKTPWWRRLKWSLYAGQSRLRRWLSNKIYKWEDYC